MIWGASNSSLVQYMLIIAPGIICRKDGKTRLARRCLLRWERDQFPNWYHTSWLFASMVESSRTRTCDNRTSKLHRDHFVGDLGNQEAIPSFAPFPLQDCQRRILLCLCARTGRKSSLPVAKYQPVDQFLSSCV